MHRSLLFIFCMMLLFACEHEHNFTELENITIYRDQWGVPHIHAPTDQEVAYGLAWATCEDDFKTMQEQMLAMQGKFGEIKGKDGVVADFAIHFMGIVEKAKSEYNSIDPKVQSIIEHYTAGVNAYAASHKDEMLLSSSFPIEKHFVVAGYMLGLVEISGAAEDLKKIMDLSIAQDEACNFPSGSNAIAINSKRSASGESFLAINSHQPLEGWYSWYEAHLISDEGQNILGGTFPGGATIFHGTNEYLGWAHTVNHADFSDVYKLEMHPSKKEEYLVDGVYKKLEKKKLRAWVKIAGPIKIPVSRTVYTSDFGITFETDEGIYAWRFAAHDAVKSIEQWYRMNRATDFDSFTKALRMQEIPCTNLVYADNQDNIYYLSNGKIPIREEGWEWQEVLPGTDSELQWDDGYWSLDSLPQKLNPDCGYVFNTNNSPFVSTDSRENPDYNLRHVAMGYLKPELNNNRSARLSHLMDADTSITYDEFKAIKYDLQYPETLATPYIVNQELLLKLDPQAYPDIDDAIEVIWDWNRRTDADNEEALLILLAADFLARDLKAKGLYERGYVINKDQCAVAIQQAKELMLGNYGRLRIPLGDVQRHMRGDVSLPMGGGGDILAAAYSVPIEDGLYHMRNGESYIQLVRFKRDSLPVIETINAYGTSAVPGDPHFTDQMELFTKQKLKPMTLDLEQVKKNAVEVYHPLGI